MLTGPYSTFLTQIKSANSKVAIGGSIRPNIVKKVVIISKIDPYDIIGIIKWFNLIKVMNKVTNV
jgi:hypothetical protein